MELGLGETATNFHWAATPGEKSNVVNKGCKPSSSAKAPVIKLSTQSAPAADDIIGLLTRRIEKTD